MSSEKSQNKHRHEFGGCVELVPIKPTVIEFITAKRLWGIPIRQLDCFVLGDNPIANGKKTSPNNLLILVFETCIVFLFGWRLELMLDPLMQGRVKRVHAEKYLGTLIIEEPWVSEIKVIPRFEAFPL